MKRISYRIANFILIAALLLSGAVTAHAASTTEASEKVQLRSDCTLDVTYSSGNGLCRARHQALAHCGYYRGCAVCFGRGLPVIPIQVTGTSSERVG